MKLDPQSGRYLGIGMEISGTILGGALLGWFADGWLGTKPWLLIAGVFAGTMAAAWILIRLAKETSKEADSE